MCHDSSTPLTNLVAQRDYLIALLKRLPRGSAAAVRARAAVARIQQDIARRHGR